MVDVFHISKVVDVFYLSSTHFSLLFFLAFQVRQITITIR